MDFRNTSRDFQTNVVVVVLSRSPPNSLTFERFASLNLLTNQISSVFNKLEI